MIYLENKMISYDFNHKKSFPGTNIKNHLRRPGRSA